MAAPTEAQIDRYREIIGGKKLRFEKSFKILFRNWQKAVFDSFVGQVNFGMTVTKVPNNLKKDLNVLLTNHYHDVAEDFVPGLEYEEIKQSPSGDPLPGTGGPTEEEDEGDDFLMLWLFKDIHNFIDDQIFLQQPVHAGSIIDTAERDGTESVVHARGEPGEEDDVPYPIVLRNKMASRTTTTSITEVDWIAEASMNTSLEVTTPATQTAGEAQMKELQKVSPNVTLKEMDIDAVFAGGAVAVETARRILRLPTKTWITMADKKVRPSHQAALGITIPINEPFILSGGLLMYPADSSLGVAFREVVNCRCHALYT